MSIRSIPRASRFPMTRLALLISLNSLCLISPFIQADDN
ncbi:TonB-dependent receptor, partial [Pseudomonas syringae pv. actinidiae ICMP 19079]